MELQGVFANIFNHDQFLDPNGFFETGLPRTSAASARWPAVQRRRSQEATGKSKWVFGSDSSQSRERRGLGSSPQNKGRARSGAAFLLGSLSMNGVNSLTNTQKSGTSFGRPR